MQVEYEEIAVFNQSRFISEMIQDRPYLLWNADRNSYAIYRMVKFSMTFSDPSKSRHCSTSNNSMHAIIRR